MLLNKNIDSSYDCCDEFIPLIILNGAISIIENVLYNLRNDDEISKKLVDIREIKSHEGTYSDLDGLPSPLSNYLKNKKIQLFKHQADLTKLARKGKNVIITTPTASGKTLAFSLPILEEYANNDKATALFLYPANALIADQLSTLKGYQLDTGIRVDPYSYNKDTPQDQKPHIRENVRTLLTTPHMLHLILYWKHQWSDFYSNLKYVVIDEAHEYSGVFGSNVALLIRRLRRICNFYGSNPQFILSSATLANPLEFSQLLIGKDFELINQDASASGTKHMVFFNPYQKDNNPSIRLDTRNLLSMFVLCDLQTLCFTKTKNDAEKIVTMAKSFLKKDHPEVLNQLSPYRAGYESGVRRDIENQLKNRQLMGVTCTNALELGVDIGSLDAVIISSYPGTLISTWQQAGRAGRGVKDSVVVFVASQDPLNQYIVNHPQYILQMGNENATVDLKNEHLLKKHLYCACSELSISSQDLKDYFNVDDKLMKLLQQEGKVFKGPKVWEYNNHQPQYPALLNKLKFITPAEYEIKYKGKTLENITREDAYSICYEGAVYRHKARRYTVKKFNLNKKIIFLMDYQESSKRSWKKTEIINRTSRKSQQKGILELHFGEITVKKSYGTYEKYENKRISYEKLDIPPTTFQTNALWFEIPQAYLSDLKNYQNETVESESVDGVRSAIIAMMPLHILCGRCDILGHYNQKDPTDNNIYFYDNHPGGVGLAEKAMETFTDLVKITLDMVKKCTCKMGCVKCILSSPCGVHRGKLNKKGTIFLLEKIYSQIKEDEIDEPDNPPINISKGEGLNLPEFPEAFVDKKKSPIEEDISITDIPVKHNSNVSPDKFIDLIENKLYSIALEQIQNSQSKLNFADQIQIAMILTLQNNFNQAKKFYNNAFNLKNDYEYPHLLINLLLSHKCFFEALSIIQTLEDVLPHDNNLLLKKGIVLESVKYLEEAAECYNILLTRDPNNMEAYQRLISI
ncbi:MAG: DEAD/DEAH box helicase [Methanobacterium sp.]